MASSPAASSTTRRRVSYVIPPPSDQVPRLVLPPDGTPRYGQTGPLLRGDPSQGRLSSTSSQLSESASSHSTANGHSHPKHRLGITSFALDASTFLEGRQTPSGILYSGGRDGMLMAWDLALPMRLRTSPSSVSLSTSGTSHRLGRWERLTSEEEDLIEEEEEEEEWPMSDGDVLGDVIPSGGLRGVLNRTKNSSELPYEKQWELDVGQLKPGQPAYWRQHTQAHTDWVNDILLCNVNQTVISGSSDGTVKAWNPHSPHDRGAAAIGTHSDYVRCLSQCSERKWILSGSFDRTIKIWDTSESRPTAVNTLLPPDPSSAKASVYALAADPMGHVIAAGGPERVIRTWDPRTGKRVGKLVGHTDNIRAILISEDSRYLLTGSADASIKLWSLLSPQRCIHTFTHHTESVWSLHSSHPNLETFYSGDRSGLVCRVDVEQCSKMSEGECTVLLQDNADGGLSSSDGVSEILAMDDHLVWTASGSSSIRRWRVPQSRTMRSSPAGKLAHSISMPSPKAIHPPLTSHASNHSLDHSTRRRLRGESMTPSITASIFSDDASLSDHIAEAETTLEGIPYDCLVHLASPGTGPSLLSTVSVVKLTHRQSLSVGQSTLVSSNSGPRRDTLGLPVPDGLPLQTPQTAKAAYEERDVAPDAVPLISEPDFISEGAHGLVRALTLNDRVHALTVDTAGTVAVWDIIRSRCLGIYPREVVQCASDGSRGTSVATGAVADSQEDQTKKLSPRQALEIVRERIEGEAVVNAWSNVDTKIGELTVHIAERCFDSEIFADEVGFKNSEKNSADDQRINVGKWILRNLFINFIHEEQRAVTRVSHDTHKGHHRHHSGGHHRSKSAHVISDRHGTVYSSTPLIPAIPPAVSNFKLQHLTPIAQSPDTVSGNGQSTPKPLQAVLPNFGGAAEHARSHTSNTIPTAVTVSGSSSNGSGSDYFSIRRRPSTSQSQSGSTQTPGPEDDFSGWGGPGSSRSSTHETPATPSTPGGGLMGKLKSFGKASRKVASESDTPSVIVTAAPSEPSTDEATLIQPRSLAARLKAQYHQLTPPSGHESPLVTLPFDVTILISEELSSGWSPIYSGTLAQQSTDIEELEKNLPDWLVEFLLLNKAPSTPVTKISFVLLPYAIPPELRAVYGHTLPELLNTSQTKLTAGRFLRVKKLTYHVQDKLDRGIQSKSNSPRSSTDMMHISGGGSTSSPRTPFSAPPPLNSSHSHSHQSHAQTHHAHSYSISSQNPLQHTQQQRDLPRAEEAYEIICNDQLLPLEMTLAAVRQFVWRQSGELVMHYRRKPALPHLNPSPTFHVLSPTRSHSPLVNANLNPFATTPVRGPHLDVGATPHSAPAQTAYFNPTHTRTQSHPHTNPFTHAGRNAASISSSSLNRVDSGRGSGSTSHSRGTTPSPSPSTGYRSLPSTTPGGTPKAI